MCNSGQSLSTGKAVNFGCDSSSSWSRPRVLEGGGPQRLVEGGREELRRVCGHALHSYSQVDTRTHSVLEWPLPPLHNLNPPTKTNGNIHHTAWSSSWFWSRTWSLQSRTERFTRLQASKQRHFRRRGGRKRRGPPLVLFLRVVVGGQSGPRHRDQAGQRNSTPGCLEEFGQNLAGWQNKEYRCF